MAMPIDAAAPALRRADTAFGSTVITIVGFRNPDDIRLCLDALSRSIATDFSVVICENGGDLAYRSLLTALYGRVNALVPMLPAGDDRIVEAWRGQLAPISAAPDQRAGQNVLVLRARGNLGYAGGVNACIGEIRADPDWTAIWVLNPDTEPHPDALQALVDHAASDRYGIVGSRLVFKGTDRVQLYGGRWRKFIARGFNIGLNASAADAADVAKIERTMTYVNGASMYVTRSFITSVGTMDERYFLYCEEVDWCFRRGDFRLGYAHGSLIHHAHGSVIGSNANRRLRSSLSVYLDERNKLLFTRRFFPRRYPLVVLVTLLLTVQYLKAGAFANFGVALAGWLAAIRNEEGLPERFRRQGLGSDETPSTSHVRTAW
ncbi:MAG: glycosyltransferase [Azospirillaceae bacterium]|nr:glycosyltransferase [Azospirillaceae bacterium]